MISGFQSALRNAIDVIAPPATPLQDFVYHWKQLMNFYASHLTDCKAPIESTGIPRHLDKLLEILLLEEKDIEEPGPCLEYLLQHKLLDLLATLAGAETPPGMRLVCLYFFRQLLTKSKHTLLHHVSIYGPVQRLISMCNGTVPSPIESEEVQFLLTLCFLVCKYPYITSIVNDSSILPSELVAQFKQPENLDNQQVTYRNRKLSANPLFESLNTQAVTLVNPNLFEGTSKRPTSIYQDCDKLQDKMKTQRKNFVRSSTSSRSSGELEVNSQSSSPVSQKNSAQNGIHSSEISDQFEHLRIDQDNAFGLEEGISSTHCHKQSLTPKNAHSKCLLLDSLKSYINSADHAIRVRACEGIMVLASLEDASFTNIVAQSDLAVVLSERLERLFNFIPAHVDANEIEDIQVTWGLDTPLLAQDKKFAGCRRVATFFMWYDFCDQLVKEANPRVAVGLAKTIRRLFLDKTVSPTLSSHHAVLITALVVKMFKATSAVALTTELNHWLVGQHRDPDISDIWSWCVLQTLINNCYTESDDLTIMTLKLFEDMIEKRDEHIVHCLVLMYLNTRGYYDNTATDSAIASWSDEEDERERDKKNSSDLSQGHQSKTLAPNSIHRIINCFLSLVPRSLQTDSDVNNYERYMIDWEKQYTVVLRDCALFAWPLEAVSIDDSASSDSRPEADHLSARFHVGPFLTMLLNKLSNIPNQKYSVNLQLTVVISKLALLPHPYLHEFLLNPLIPLASGRKSLFSCLQKVIKQLVNEVQKIPNFKPALRQTRINLLNGCYEQSREGILYESIVITEEFCKELAAIAYVKYHHSI